MLLPSRSKSAAWFAAAVVLLAAATGVLLFSRSTLAVARTPPSGRPVMLGPTFELDPSEGEPGTVVHVSGQGWRQDDDLYVRIVDPGAGANAPVAAFPLTSVPRGGKFSATFTFPARPAFAEGANLQVTVLAPRSGDRFAQSFYLAKQAISNAPPPSPVPSSTPAHAASGPIATAQPEVVPGTSTIQPGSPAPADTPTPIVNAWQAEYFSSPDLSGEPALVRGDKVLDFSWNSDSPAPGVPTANFSARWTQLVAFEEGFYRFDATANDGVRVYVDEIPVIDAWQTGPLRQLAGDVWLATGTHSVRVEYFHATGDAALHLLWERVAAPQFADWQAEYWANQELAGSPVLQRDEQDINFQWTTAGPAPNLPAQHFSARWTRWYDFSPGLYEFQAQADDAMRVYVDGTRIIDNWQDSDGSAVDTVRLGLSGRHRLVVEYYQDGGAAFARFGWNYIAQLASPTPTISPGPTNTATSILLPSATPAPPTPAAPRAPTDTAAPARSPAPAPTGTPVPPPSDTAVAPTSTPDAALPTETSLAPGRAKKTPLPTNPPSTSAPPPTTAPGPTSPPATSVPGPTNPPATSVPGPTSPPATSIPGPTSPPATSAPAPTRAGPAPKPTKPAKQ